LHFFFHETHLYSKIRISLIKRRAGLDVMQSQPLHVQGRISANTAPHHHDSNFCSSSQFWYAGILFCIILPQIKLNGSTVEYFWITWC